jgi:uroporphyrinogen-III synthase
VTGRLVLNTRPTGQSSELSALLRKAGFDVMDAPATAIVPAWDASTLDEVRLEFARGDFDWIVLPSQNAGRGLETELRADGGRVVCGTATARALGLDRARTVDRFSAAAALEFLRPLVTVEDRVLVPRAAEGREELVDGLRALGVEVVAPIAYRTIPVPDAADRLRLGHVDVVALCSPSAVRSVAQAVGDDALVVCLGETTAAAARDAALRVAGVAPRPTMAALVDAIEAIAGAAV